MSTPRFLELPPGVERVEITTDIGPVAALRAEPAAGGRDRRTALLVPGLTGSKEDFIALLQTLAQAGRSVVAIDLPGQYQSPEPQDFGSYGTGWLGRAVASVVDAIDEGPLHLLGHSYGGQVVRETAIGAEVPLLSLVLMSSGPGPVVSAGRVASARQLISYLHADPSPAQLQRLWDDHLDAVNKASGLPGEIQDFLRVRMTSNGPRSLVRMCEDILGAEDRTDLLRSAEAPLLVLCGEHDDAWPPALQAEMADRLGARKVVVPGAAHSPNVEAPETTASALTAFWNSAETAERT
ncbi:alpha/beta fold hydrolase [Nocardiopsis coralliicola]